MQTMASREEMKELSVLVVDRERNVVSRGRSEYQSREDERRKEEKKTE